MKTSELLNELVKPEDEDCPTGTCGGDDEEEIEVYDDEDFWEALDLLQTARKQMLRILDSNGVSDGRKRVLQNHCDDIGQFLNHFIEFAEEK